MTTTVASMSVCQALWLDKLQQEMKVKESGAVNCLLLITR